MTKRPKRRPLFGSGVNPIRRIGNMIADCWQIRRSGRFDSAHYLAQIKQRRLKHYFPLTHYVVSGERKGLEPAPGFAPLLYLGQNEHLVDLQSNLFAHFLKGHRQSNVSNTDTGFTEVASAQRLLLEFAPKYQVAIVCHIFYFHLVDEVMKVIRELNLDFDVICTVTRKPGMEDVIARINTLYPRAVVLPFPNVGRDIFPFVWLAGAGALSSHAAVCKVHSKKSLLRADGDRWRRTLIEASLGNSVHVRRMIDTIRSDSAVGLITADEQIVDGDEYWGPNRGRTAELCARIGIDINAYPLRFASGSIFWLHPRVIERLNALRLTIGDFEEETGQIDGTTAHAVERVIGFVVQSLGLQMREAGRY
jgi:lipopolysaccharide biosynthesis protein